MTRLRVGVVCDFLEERWPSMDLAADHLLDAVQGNGACVDAVRLRPPMTPRLVRMPFVRSAARCGTIDRLLNRHVDYPVWLSRRSREFAIFHIVDHSYAQLVHVLPAARTIVTCHDLDTFRCLLAPQREPRSFLFRGLARRTLDGLLKAARVLCVSEAVRSELAATGLIASERLRVIPNGVEPFFTPEPDTEADAAAAALLGPVRPGAPEVLHVASPIPRKRVDVVLSAFALLRRNLPEARLVRAGGALGVAERLHATALGVTPHLVELPFLGRRTLAAVYRRASALILPSDREGFGLPALEALASGTPAVLSSIPALRETGADAALYCPPGDAETFARALRTAVERRDPDRRARGLVHAARFTWTEHARRVLDVYREVASGGAV